MKKILLLLSVGLLFFACQTNISPIVVETKIENGVKMEYEVDTVRNVKHGFYKEYHPNSEHLFMECVYRNDTLTGTEKIYFESGKLKQELVYKNGVYEGSFKEYFEDGKVLQEGVFKNGQYEGAFKTYYANGKLKETVQMKNGQEDGAFEQYFEDGNIKAKGTLKYYEKKAHEYCLLEMYSEDGTGKLTKKMICNGEGGCCTIWELEKGDVPPSSDLCAKILDQMKEECQL